MRPRCFASGFTLIELLVVVAIIAVIAAILFPVFARAREKARQTACASNIRQIAAAWTMYAQDNDEMACPSYYFQDDFGREFAWDFILDWTHGTWTYGLLGPYTRSGELNRCSTFYGNAWGRPYTGYAYNVTYIGGDVLNGIPMCALAQIQQPADAALIADGGFGNPVQAENYLRAPHDPAGLFTAGKVDFRHNLTANVAYADGHAHAAAHIYLYSPAEPECGALSADDSAYDLN